MLRRSKLHELSTQKHVSQKSSSYLTYHLAKDLIFLLVYFKKSLKSLQKHQWRNKSDIKIELSQYSGLKIDDVLSFYFDIVSFLHDSDKVSQNRTLGLFHFCSDEDRSDANQDQVRRLLISKR